MDAVFDGGGGTEAPTDGAIDGAADGRTDGRLLIVLFPFYFYLYSRRKKR